MTTSTFTPETADRRTGTILLLFFALLADGFDTAAFAFLIPTLSRQWGVTPATFTAPLVIANIGAVIGFLLCGRLSALWGRYVVIAGSVALFSLGTLLLPLTTSVATMSVVRLFIGLGFGAVIPAAVSLGAESVPGRWRSSTSIAVLMGLSCGAAVGGFAGGAMIERLGWHSVFWLPGTVFLVLSAVMWWRLPRTGPDLTATDSRHRSGILSLFAPGLRISTVLLGLFALIVFAAYYTLQSWLPTLVVGTGSSPAQAPLAAAALGLGGIIGGALLAFGSAFVGAARLLVVVVGLAIVFLVVAGTADLSTSGLLFTLGVVGAGLVAGCNGQAAVAVQTYDDANRTTGVALASGLGRVGSVVGPAVGGLLIALNRSVDTILLALVVPLVIALGTAAVLALRTRHGSRRVALVAVEPIAAADAQ